MPVLPWPAFLGRSFRRQVLSGPGKRGLAASQEWYKGADLGKET